MGMPVVARGVGGVLGVLFIAAAAVQLNDPDPIVWMLWYGSAAVFCAVAAADRLPWRPTLAFAVVAFAYSVVLFSLGHGSAEPAAGSTGGLLDDEVVREALGLAWIGVSMAGLAAVAWQGTRDQQPP